MRWRRLLVIAAVAASPACGLLGGDATEIAPPTDGVGDFGASAPIEVCIGTARAVAPSATSAATAALCIADGDAATTCADDASCDGIERCVCGRCVVEACSGGSCGEGRVCRDGRCTLACAADQDCGDGDRCAAGGCARTCTSDAACHHGELCDQLFEACRASACSDAIPCAPGSTCEPQTEVVDLREPDVTSAGAAFAFVELRGVGISRARIDDASHWSADPVAPALSGDVGAPAALVSGDHVDLWFEAPGGIGHATSDDGGATFTRDAALVVEPQLAWERGHVGSPSVVEFLGRRLLFYEAGHGDGIGYVDLDDATRAETPIVTPEAATDPLLWRGVTAVGAPHAIVSGDALRLYFTGRGVEGFDAIIDDAGVPADANDSIGLFATRDLESWWGSRIGPVFARVTNLRAYLGESEASIAIGPAGAEIIFVSSDSAGVTSGLARAGF